jgi:hypothetical protein
MSLVMTSAPLFRTARQDWLLSLGEAVCAKQEPFRKKLFFQQRSTRRWPEQSSIPQYKKVGRHRRSNCEPSTKSNQSHPKNHEPPCPPIGLTTNPPMQCNNNGSGKAVSTAVKNSSHGLGSSGIVSQMLRLKICHEIPVPCLFRPIL